MLWSIPCSLISQDALIERDKGGGCGKRVGGSSESRMPMTGLEAIWASGTICTVGATERGLIIGQPLLPEYNNSPQLVQNTLITTPHSPPAHRVRLCPQ